jgi:phospholipase/carboxylesterase
MPLKSYTHSPKSGKAPTSMVILLHGLGANGQDLIDLARYWENDLPDTVFVSPDAPFPCDMAPMGYQWFSLQSWSPQMILEGVENATPFLNDFVDRMAEHYNIPDSKIALMGFSQGTMMSLYAGPRRKNKIAGVLGYSGALVGAETLGNSEIHKIPIHLIHGNMDMVVPVMAYYDAKSKLESNGFTVSGGITNGLPHSIDEDGIMSGAAFFKSVLK